MHNLPLASYRHKYVFTYLVSSVRNLTFNNTVKKQGNTINSKRIIFLLLFVLGSFLYSCSPVKNSVYFQNLQKDTTLRHLVSKDLEPKIQNGDILGISVASLSPDVAFYNNASPSGGAAASSSSSPAASAAPSSGYLVDTQGNIDFVKLGSIHAAGLTKKELKAILDSALVPYLKYVSVSITFLNRHVTILGGVTTQVLPMAGDNMTILDALAASGDITEKGRTDNVLVIREKGDSAKEFKRVNLTNSSIFSSTYFFLQPNDIVYVEPKKVKPPISTVQLVTIISSAVSLIILILNTVKL